MESERAVAPGPLECENEPPMFEGALQLRTTLPGSLRLWCSRSVGCTYG
jgi:hypothetical protein